MCLPQVPHNASTVIAGSDTLLPIAPHSDTRDSATVLLHGRLHCLHLCRGMPHSHLPLCPSTDHCLTVRQSSQRCHTLMRGHTPHQYTEPSNPPSQCRDPPCCVHRGWCTWPCHSQGGSYGSCHHSILSNTTSRPVSCLWCELTTPPPSHGPHPPVMMAFPSGLITTALHVNLGRDSLSSSLPVAACHTRTSLTLLVANSSEDPLGVTDTQTAGKLRQ